MNFLDYVVVLAIPTVSMLFFTAMKLREIWHNKE